MAALKPSDISFTVCRHEPEMVAPVKATPCEMKVLSDIDNHNRIQIPLIQFYRGNPSMEGKDPVEIIRKALAETLVFYYPFAGRLREGHNGKLIVHCNGEGVVFIEADADVTLEEFGDLHPPFPCIEDLIYDVPGSSDILNTPLLIIQVTRLKCSGFIFAIRLNHTMCDAVGIVQFMSGLGEIACGARQPSTLPIWQRELLNARDPPRVTCVHREVDEVIDIKKAITSTNMVYRSFFFGPNEISLIRTQIPNHLRQSSTFEIITAFIWRYRTMALQLNANENVSLNFVVNVRSKFNPPLPKGYYGNAIAFTISVTTAGELCSNPLGYALELVKKMKGVVTEEYVHSLIDYTATKGRTPIKTGGVPEELFIMSDVTRFGFVDVDFGWGKAAYGGLTNVVIIVGSFCIRYKNAQGEEGVVAPLCLRGDAMERFTKELDGMSPTSTL